MPQKELVSDRVYRDLLEVIFGLVQGSEDRDILLNGIRDYRRAIIEDMKDVLGVK